MNKHNLFIVGQPKAGTTALYYYLREHPDIFFPEQKELHHFAEDLNQERLKFHGKISDYFNYNLKQYLKHFENCKDEIICGDATPTYLFSKCAAEKIFKFNPKSKIIAIFREPIDYLYSYHSQLLFQTYENEKNFIHALELEEERKKGHRIPWNVREPSLLYYGEKVKYGTYLKRFIDIFPLLQLKIILYDDFRQNSSKIVREIFEFIGVDSTFETEYKIHNPNEKPRFYLLKKIATSQPVSFYSQKILPNSIFRLIKKAIYTITTIKQERVPLNQETRIELMKKYKPEVIHLNKLLHDNNLIDKDKDLIKLWSYDQIE